MDMYKLKFTRLQNEIFRLLCIKAGMSLNQRGISRLLGVSPTAISKSVKGLEKEELIEISRENNFNVVSVRLNRENSKSIALKRIENLKLVYESGFVDFLEEKFPGCTIILFGSYSLGEDTQESDIDIAVIGSKQKQIDLVKFDKMLERPIFLHYYQNFNMEKNIRASILSGILLTGSIEIGYY
jgi:predicted nucleotidyltransferase